jgi:hypothetical protein
MVAFLGLSNDAVAGLIGALIGATASLASTIGVEAWRARQTRRERDRARAEQEQTHRQRVQDGLRDVMQELEYNDGVNRRPLEELQGLGAQDAWNRNAALLANELSTQSLVQLRDAYARLATAKHWVDMDQPNSASDERQALRILIPQALDALKERAGDTAS